MESISCNLCGSNDAVPILAIDRFDVLWRLVRCIDCGLVRLDPRPTMEEMGKYYEGYGLHVDLAPPGPPAGWREQLRRTLQRAALEVGCGWPPDNGAAWLGRFGGTLALPFLGRRVPWIGNGRLLDIGCGNGEFLRWMINMGAVGEMIGVEMGEAGCRAARSIGLDVRRGTVEDMAFPDAHFNVVTMWGVLEHLHDPKAALVEVRRILHPDGHLVLIVPNFNCRERRLFGRRWYHVAAPWHLVHFTPTTLLRMLEAAGFDNIGINCIYGGSARVGAKMYIRDYPQISQLARIIWRAGWPLWMLNDLTSRGEFVRATCQK